MTSRKKLIRVFEDFGGVDYSKSDLTRPSNAFKKLTNFQFGTGRELTLRKGFHPTGQIGGFIGGGTHHYTAPTSGDTVEEMLACTNQLFRLDYPSFTITYGGAGTWNYGLYPGSGAFAAQYVFALTETIAGVPTTVNIPLGPGIYDVDLTVAGLVDAISAVAGFTAALAGGTKFAKVNGLQSGVTTITVDAGHNIAVLDWIQFYDYISESLVAVKVTAITATSFSFSASFPTVTVADNQIIGPAAAPAAGIRQYAATSALVSPYTIPYPSWTPIKYQPFTSSSSVLSVGPFTLHKQLPYRAWRQPQIVSAANDVAYIGVTRGVSNNPSGDDDVDCDGKILKYDGNRVYRAGMLAGEAVSFTPSAGTDTWRYMITRQQLDAAGNYVEGEPSEWFTATSATTPVTCVFTNVSSLNSADHGAFNVACALINGNQSGAGTQTGLTVVNTPHTLMPGDRVAIFDGVTSSIVYRTLTAVSTTTITWNSTTAISAFNGQPISCGLIHRIWRTKNGGIKFYLVNEFPNNVFATTTTLTDSLADASLVIEYEESDILARRDPPPAANFLCFHQGCMVATGDRDYPNMVHISAPGQYEYFPRAYGNFEVASSTPGMIRAIGSDSDNRLAMFKQNAYYDVDGDITSPLGFSVRAVHEGDFGVISQFSLVKVKDKLCGISRLGPVSIRDGILSPEFGAAIAPAIRQMSLSDVGGAFAANDSRNFLCRVLITSPDAALTVQSFVADYEKVMGNEGLAAVEGGNISWLDWEYGNTTPTRGIYVNSSEVFNLNGQCFREHRTATDTFPGQSATVKDYHDACQAIGFHIATTAFHAGMPGVDKQWLRLKIYGNIGGDINLRELTSFSAEVSTYRNLQDAPMGAHTSTEERWEINENFTRPYGGYEKEIHLKSAKARFLEFWILGGAIGERPTINGFELMFAENYELINFAE